MPGIIWKRRRGACSREASARLGGPRPAERQDHAGAHVPVRLCAVAHARPSPRPGRLLDAAAARAAASRNVAKTASLTSKASRPVSRTDDRRTCRVGQPAQATETRRNGARHPKISDLTFNRSTQPRCVRTETKWHAKEDLACRTAKSLTIWRRWKGGESLSAISRALEKNPGSVHGVLQLQGGIAPRPRRRASRALTMAEREEISRGGATGRTFRAIAIDIRRAPSTIGREVSRNGGRTSYRAERAGETARRLKECGLATQPKLCRLVAKKLQKNWSPQQISGWLRRQYGQDASMRVSPETRD